METPCGLYGDIWYLPLSRDGYWDELGGEKVNCLNWRKTIYADFELVISGVKGVICTPLTGDIIGVCA
jgi:hypothetical protein